MPYHIFVHANGFFIPPGDCDIKTEDEVLNNYCVPYHLEKPITIGGAIIERKNIIRLAVYSSRLTLADIVRIEPLTPTYRSKQAREYNIIRNSRDITNISSEIMKKAESIADEIKKENSAQNQSSIFIANSNLYNSPITGIMEQSTLTININKQEVENWLRQIEQEMKMNNLANEELTAAIEIARAALQAPKPTGAVIKAAVEAVKAIGYGMISSALWQALMARPPL